MNEFDEIFGKQYGVGITRGFNGEVQFYKGGKTLSGEEHNKLLSNYSKGITKAKDQKTRQGVMGIVQALDPSGVSNYQDTYRTLKSDAPIQEKLFSVVGALPMLGKLETPMKLSKGTLKGEKALSKIEKASKMLDKITPRTALDTRFEGLTQKAYNKLYPKATQGFVSANRLAREDKLNLLFSASNVSNKVGDLMNVGEAGSNLYDSYVLSKQMQDMKNKKKKFAYGGSALNIDSPSQDLAKMRRVTEEARYETMNDPTVAGLRGLGTTLMNTGFSMVSQGMAGQGDMDGVGGFFQDNLGDIKNMSGLIGASSSFATGGTIPANLEGGEVVETPAGEPFELSGPSHAEGGIDMNLPHGTDIYSKRIKVNGETMADRKNMRERQLDKFQKLFDKNPLDNTLKNTLSRVKANMQTLDDKDMMIQNILHKAHNSDIRAFGGTLDEEDESDDNYLYDDEDELYDESYIDEDEDIEDAYEEEFAVGGTIPGYYDEGDDEDLINKYPTMSNRGMNNTYLDSQGDLTPLTRPNSGIQPIDIPNRNPMINDTNSNRGSSILGNIMGNMSLGDMIGMGGQLYGAFSGRANTLANRRGDTPNINPYRDYGAKGLELARQARQGLDYNRDQTLADLERSRNSMLGRARNSARGINTLRALNLVTDQSVNNSRAKVYSDYNSKLSNMLLGEANMQNQIDERRMSEEYTRDMNDRRDRDNFFSQIRQDNQSIAEGIQRFGKNLNTGKERDMTSQALSALSKYFDVDITASGMTLTNKKKK